MHAIIPETAPTDPHRLTPLVRENRRWVEAVARRQLGDPALAEEVAQDVFLRLAALPRPPQEPAALRTWLVRSVWYLCANARRKATRRKSAEALAAQEISAVYWAASAGDSLPLEELAAALDSLPALEHALVLEHFFEGLAHHEIGVRHHLSGEAARKRISRALHHLRAHLTRRGVAVPMAVLASGLTVAGSASRATAADLFRSALLQWIPQAPGKLAAFTAAACAAVALPVIVHQHRELENLQQAAAARHPQEPILPLPEPTIPLPGEGLNWTPQNLDTASFPDVPPMAQWILTSIPIMPAGPWSDSAEPLSLRVTITMSESVGSLIHQRKVGLIDMERVLREYQQESGGNLKLAQARERTSRELAAMDSQYHDLQSRLSGARNILRDPLASPSERRESDRDSRALHREAEALAQRMAQFQERRGQQLRDQEFRLRRTLLADVITHLQEKIRRDHLDLIFDGNGDLPGSGFVLSFDGVASDISTEVIAELNQSAPFGN